jgi:hypothetical protein
MKWARLRLALLHSIINSLVSTTMRRGYLKSIQLGLNVQVGLNELSMNIACLLFDGGTMYSSGIYVVFEATGVLSRL